MLLHPRTKGSVTLRSTDPLDPPVINANAMADPLDAKVIAEGKALSKLSQNHLFSHTETYKYLCFYI